MSESKYRAYAEVIRSQAFVYEQYAFCLEAEAKKDSKDTMSMRLKPVVSHLSADYFRMQHNPEVKPFLADEILEVPLREIERVIKLTVDLAVEFDRYQEARECRHCGHFKHLGQCGYRHRRLDNTEHGCNCTTNLTTA